MKNQNYMEKNERIKERFLEKKKAEPGAFKPRLNLSWSNWGFGAEKLQESVKRLRKNGIRYIELHGNHYGPDLGYKPRETLKILGDAGIKAAGTCGMFSRNNDLSSNNPFQRQGAVDYIRRELEFAEGVGGTYLLVVPGAVGRPEPYDDMEFERSAETLKGLGDLFLKHKVLGAVEPIRTEEVSFCHTVADAKRYIRAVGHKGLRHINCDVFHMQAMESHIGEAIIDAGDMLVNLHIADSNRLALGDGSLDLDTIIMALYLIGYNKEGRFVTPEPLGPGGDVYRAMNGKPDSKALDRLVSKTAAYFREWEEEVLML